MAMELSSDLIEEILSWVPANSLVLLKYTCKHWQTLISDPRFVKKHFSHMCGREQQFSFFKDISKSEPSLSFSSPILSLGIDEIDKPDLNIEDFEPLHTSNLLVESMYHCDGLLLFVMKTHPLNFKSDLLVMNPLLKQARWIKCGYDFNYLIHTYGLGYIANQSSSSLSYNDYKMVRFSCGAYDLRAEIYDFKSDCWDVVVVDKSFDGFLELPESSVCLRGTPYWIGSQDGKRFSMILKFDFSRERFETLSLPQSSKNKSSKFENSLILGVYKGDKLSLLHKSRVTGETHLWVMKKHCWMKLMTVCIPEICMYTQYSSYFVSKNGRIVLSIRKACSFEVYIVGTESEGRVFKYDSMDPTIGGCGCYYVPSLLPVPCFSASKRR